MRSTKLVEPTPNLVRRYVKRFDDMNSTDEKALFLLLEAFPANAVQEHILLKVVAINTLYKTNIFDVHPVAQHIHHLRADTKIGQGDKEVVDKIARITIEGKTRNNYSFATKFCSWHNPDAYPIYDAFVDKLLMAYKRTYNFASFKQDDLYEYPKFSDILSRFRARFRLREFNWKQLDKFLWLYGHKIA